MKVINNSFKIIGAYVANVLDTGQGSNNIIQDNIIDGGWDGTLESIFDVGADNGILIRDEDNILISGNTINNNYCSAIETNGYMQNSRIINNKINNAGLNGIGGWYHFKWIGNTIESNIVDDTGYMFFILNGSGDINPVLFKDNIFTNNIFKRQKPESYIGPTGDYSSKIDLEDLPPSRVTLNPASTNNIFSNNDFNPLILSPVLIPVSMIIDQGQNQCLASADTTKRPLKCTTPGATPAPSPTPVPSGVQPEFCLQVMTFGQNPKTGECKGFTNSCLPPGWIKVKSCEKIREQP